jgi:hypothetical protein
MTFDIREFFENLSRKFKFNYNLTRITGKRQKVKQPHYRPGQAHRVAGVLYKVKVPRNRSEGPEGG